MTFNVAGLLAIVWSGTGARVGGDSLEPTVTVTLNAVEAEPPGPSLTVAMPTKVPLYPAPGAKPLMDGSDGRADLS